tara:strand:- start:13 stop:597 length:585 start_codon:yes stop_codon:yes gene_type:complete
MFNGIIRNTGKIIKIHSRNSNYFLIVHSKLKCSRKEIGSSISCSGVCLTLDSFKKNKMHFYLSKETIDKTNFKKAKKNQLINLEKSLKFGDRISGHFVQGHVDTTAIIKKIEYFGRSWCITFSLKKKYMKHIIQKGSIAINGISLTISKVFNSNFQIVVIPKTLQLTNLFSLKEKDLVNIEFDILGKYAKKFLK